MNRQKQIRMENDITNTFYTIIEKRGYFNVDFDLKEVVEKIHLFYYPDASIHFIRKCFFKNIYNNKNFINQYDY